MLIEFSNIEYEFSDDWEIFEELYSDYSDSWAGLVTLIEKGHANNDAKTVEINAHTLKGIVANFYCKDIKEICYEMEVMGQEDRLAEIPQKVELFKKLNDNLLGELFKYIENKKTA